MSAHAWVFDVVSAILLSCMFLDSYIWFTQGFLVPSWTIAVMSFCFAFLVQIMKGNAVQRRIEKLIRFPFALVVGTFGVVFYVLGSIQEAVEATKRERRTCKVGKRKV